MSSAFSPAFAAPGFYADPPHATWGYVLSNGLTAEQTVVAIHAMLEALTVPTAVEVANAVWAKELP